MYCMTQMKKKFPKLAGFPIITTFCSLPC